MTERSEPARGRAHPAAAWLPPLAVALITLLVFLPTLQNQFVNWDDEVNLVNNLRFRGLGWDQLRWMFETTLLGHWIPLTWISFGADFLLWGMNPAGYHLTSLLLHSAGAVVFYFVALRLLKAGSGLDAAALRLPALAAALFFAIHPLRVESVAWATERRDVLSGLLFLLAILAYLKAAAADGMGRRRMLAVSVACYALAALSKATVMVLPAVLIVLDVYPLRRLPGSIREWAAPAFRRIWVEKLPYLVIALGTAGMAVYAQRGHAVSLAAWPLAGRIAVACYGLAFYLWKTVLPVSISPLYETPARVDPLAPAMVVSALAVAALTAGLVVLRRRWPAGLAVWVCYGLLLAPVSGLTQSGPQLVKSSYSYLACLGLAILFGLALERLRRFPSRPPGGRVATGAAAVLVLGWFAALTVRQTGVWRSSERLWSHAVALDSGSHVARSNLAVPLIEQGRFREAEEHLQAALRLNPEYESAHANLAALLARTGAIEEAGRVRARLGYLYVRHGKLAQAVELFREEVQLRPEDPSAHNDLGAALLELGEVGQAIEHFERALRIDPRDERARRNLGAARLRR